MINHQRGSSVLGGMVAVAGAGAIVAGGLIYEAGAVRVSFRDKGPGGQSIRMAVPAAVIPLAMMFVPDKALRDVPPEARRHLPAIRLAAEEMKRLPDGPLVEMSGPEESVSVVLRGGTLRVHMDSPEESVEIQVPLGAVESVLEKLLRPTS